MAEQKDILSSHTDIVGKADDRNACWTGDCGRLQNIVAAQWSENELVPIGNRPPRRRIDTKCGIVSNHLDVGNLRIGKRECGRVGNRLADIGVRPGHGQQQRNAVHAIERIGCDDNRRTLATRNGRARGQQHEGRYCQQLPQPPC